MKKSLKFTLLLIFISNFISAQPKTQWVKIGEGTYNSGFIYPYKIKFYVPYGVRNIKDIKLGLYSMRFRLDWLMLDFPKEKVDKLFYQQLEASFKNEGSFNLYKNIINSFLKHLPKVTKHDTWDFIYNPDEGTKLYIDNNMIHHLVGAELNRALVDSWIHKDPVLTSNLFNRLLKVQ